VWHWRPLRLSLVGKPQQVPALLAEQFLCRRRYLSVTLQPDESGWEAYLLNKWFFRFSGVTCIAMTLEPLGNHGLP